MLDSLIDTVVHFGGPDQQVLKVGADHVSEFVDFEQLDGVSSFDLASLMIGTVLELADAGECFDDLFLAPCTELSIKSPSTILGGHDRRIIHGDDLGAYVETFPFIEPSSLAFMLANHFEAASSMQNILASFPKMRGLTFETTGQTVSAKLHFELMPPIYTAPLSLVCTYETPTASTIIAGSQAELSFQPWEQTAMRLHLLGPDLDPPQSETLH